VRTIATCVLLLAAFAAAGIAVASPIRIATTAPKCGAVTLNEGDWIGSMADTYVIKNVLESKLGCHVKIAQNGEVPVFQAMAKGKVDAVLEDWQHVAQYRQYEQQQKTVVDAGANGLTGHSGWFVPSYVVQAHPELATWKGLRRDWTLFRSSGSATQGDLLVPDPKYVTNDQALIANLGLHLRLVYAGGEPQQITRIKQAYAKHQPLLFYWYTPQWLNAEYSLTEVLLPPRTAGCDTNLAKVDCAYPSYQLRKAMSATFARSGSPAVGVIRRFRWSAQDQDSVAVLIADTKMSPDAAAKKWIAANQAHVQQWLG
jgi:glycine betaine/proline transport system substrate-binding protein